MILETVSLSEQVAALQDTLPDCRAALSAYIHPRSNSLADQAGRWGMIVVPGGGYRILAPSEGEPVAMAFHHLGAQTFVLNYSLAPARYPAQLLELAAAAAYVRENSERYGISHLAVCGLSAGGHLTGCLCNLWGMKGLSDRLRVQPELLRPDAALFCYPVISAHAPKRSPAFGKILGEGVEAAGEYAKLSLETSVTPENPPSFVWATADDPQVPVEHSLMYVQALQNAGVPFELHLFQHGPHAMSTATRESAWDDTRVSPHVAHWVELANEWLMGEALRKK